MTKNDVHSVLLLLNDLDLEYHLHLFGEDTDARFTSRGFPYKNSKTLIIGKRDISGEEG